MVILDALQTRLLLEGVDISPGLVRASEHLVSMSGVGTRSQRMCCVVVEMWCQQHPGVVSGKDVQHDALGGVPQSEGEDLARRLVTVLDGVPAQEV